MPTDKNIRDQICFKHEELVGDSARGPKFQSESRESYTFPDAYMEVAALESGTVQESSLGTASGDEAWEKQLSSL